MRLRHRRSKQSPFRGIVSLVRGCALALLMAGQLWGVGCSSGPPQKLVKIRDDIRALVDGQVDSLTGFTDEGEFFVLVAPYTYEGDFAAFSPELRKQLTKVSRPTEEYSLALIKNDRVEADITFNTGWPYGKNDPKGWRVLHPNVLTIQGTPYTITRAVDEIHRVDLAVK